MGDIYRTFGAFRLVLATLVLVSHSGALIGDFTHLQLGNVGVLAFFVLSGFVITEALHRFYRNREGAFLVNRALKIFPAYWAALALAYGVKLWTGKADTELLAVLVNIAMLPAFLFNDIALEVSIAWAVVVEFQFYFAAAIVAALAPRNPALVIGAAISLALALSLFVHATDGFYRVYGSFRFAPQFATGVLLYFALGNPRLLWPLMFSTALCVQSTTVYMKGSLLPLALFGLCIFVLAVLVQSRFPIAKHIDRRLGDLTYPLYLCHMPLVGLAAGSTGPAVFWSVIGGSFLLAVAVHHLAEKPVVRLRDRFRRVALYG